MDWSTLLPWLTGINPAEAGPLGGMPPLGGYGINQPSDMPRPPSISVTSGGNPYPGFPPPPPPAAAAMPSAVPQMTPTPAVPFPWLGGAAFQAPGTVAGSVGGNMANAPLPPRRPSPMPAGETGAFDQGGLEGAGLQGKMYGMSPNQANAQARDKAVASGLQEAVRGMQAIPRPTAQTVRTPAAPQTRAIDTNHIINLLTSMGIGPQQAVGMGLFRR